MNNIANDFFSTPEYFIEKVVTEDAGNGNLRLFVYGRRGGTFIPLYSVVGASVDMIDFANQITEAATNSIGSTRTRTCGGLTAH